MFFRATLLKKRFARTVNIVTLTSLLSTLFTLTPMLPVRAAALESLSATLAQPIFSADWDADPTYTNVKYVWEQATAYQAAAGDVCVTAPGSCFTLVVNLQDTGVVADNQMQEWNSASLSLGDFALSPSVTNLFIASVTSTDQDNNGRDENLLVNFDCTDACVFATSTAYTLTIVNSPIKNMEQPTPYVEGVYSTTTHAVTISDLSAPNQDDATMTAITAVGKGITVTASVDPTLTFSIQGYEIPNSFYTDDVDIDNSLASDTCDFGTLTPAVPKVCAWYLNIATNASAGYSIYVVQDQDMTFNGNTIKKYDDATRVDDAAATVWNSPTAAQLAHLGYSSNDTSVFAPSGGTIAVWAGIPDIATAGQAPVITGLVADSASPGDDQYTYAIQVESAATLPQGTGYTHNQYFIVVGNF